MMNRKLKTEWCKALRSGDYKQGKSRLLNGNNEFCCLGVLCDIAIDGDWEYNLKNVWVPPIKVRRRFSSEGHLKDKAYAQLGLTYSKATTLSSMNDDGYSFNNIANYIEESKDI